jgi:hypothetical protein
MDLCAWDSYAGVYMPIRPEEREIRQVFGISVLSVPSVRSDAKPVTSLHNSWDTTLCPVRPVQDGRDTARGHPRPVFLAGPSISYAHGTHRTLNSFEMANPDYTGRR